MCLWTRKKFSPDSIKMNFFVSSSRMSGYPAKSLSGTSLLFKKAEVKFK